MRDRNLEMHQSLKQFKEEGEEIPIVKMEEGDRWETPNYKIPGTGGVRERRESYKVPGGGSRSHLARHQQEKEMKTASLEEEEREIKFSKGLEEISKSPSSSIDWRCMDGPGCAAN